MANNIQIGMERHAARKAAESAVQEARENHAYWTRQKSLRTEPGAIAHAGALVKVWKYNLKTREETLAACSLATI